MKNLKFYLFFLPALLFLQSKGLPGDEPAAASLKYPKKVNATIQAKCYGCHSPEAKSDKAKNKLNWDLLPEMTAAEQSQKLESIVKVLEEGKMPPAKFLEREPDKKLSAAETARMKKWAEKARRKASK